VVVFKNEIYNSIGAILRVEWRETKIFDLDMSSSFHQHCYFTSEHSSFFRWVKLLGGFIKVNFDGFKSSTIIAGGFIIRNWDERFFQASPSNLAATSVLIGEAATIHNVVQAAAEVGYQEIVLEVVIRCLSTH